MSDNQSHRYTIATSGTCQRMKQNNIPITRENFIKQAFPDGIPTPWTVEYEAELPEELQDFSIFGPHLGEPKTKPDEDDTEDDPDYDQSDIK